MTFGFMLGLTRKCSKENKIGAVKSETHSRNDVFRFTPAEDGLHNVIIKMYAFLFLTNFKLRVLQTELWEKGPTMH